MGSSKPIEKPLNFYPEDDTAIDPELAKYLYEHHCAFLIIEQLPVGSEFGIDLNSYSIGDKFKGVKLIPPGVHFVYASSISKAGKQSGPTSGFFHEFVERELLIRRWSSKEEEFDLSYQATEEEKGRYISNIKDLDRYLGAYRFSTYATFKNLTNRITSRQLEELVPDCQLIRAIPYLTRGDKNKSYNVENSIRIPRRTLRSCAESELSEENLLPDLKQAKETQIQFTPIPTDHKCTGVIHPNDITKFYTDTTWKLEQTFQGELSRLLGEFQFAFVTLVLGQVYESFEQWRQLLILVCLADSALCNHETFFSDFMNTLTVQMEQVPEELFDGIADQENLIRHHLDVFFQNIAELSNPPGPQFRLNLQKLRNLLESKFKWQFGLESDDERPVVVML